MLTRLIALLVFGLAALPAAAQAPREIPYQGTLADGGAPVTAATPVVFRLHDAATGGTIVWAENQTVAPDTEGRFTVRLGSVTDLPGDFDQPLWLSVTADGTALGPRTPLGAATYALGLYGIRVTPPIDAADAPSIVGGHLTNEAGRGAVVSGGGLTNGPIIRPNRAIGGYSAVGGGQGNAASGSHAAIGGGSENVASGNAATVGGGAFNFAENVSTTVGGGNQNFATGELATVAGGIGNVASGNDATVGGGRVNYAVGRGATVPGGLGNVAEGINSFAAGSYANAKHDGTFVWSGGSGAFPSSISTGPNQFLIIAADGGVGIGTNAPAAQLHVQTSELDLGTAALFNEDLLAESDDAVLGLYSNPVGAWGSAISLGEVDASGALTSKWAMARETDAAGGSLYFTFKSGPGSANYSANFPKVRFDINGTVHAGTYSSSGADLAEYFPLDEGAAAAPGQVVGLRGGRVSLATDGAEQIAVISSDPAFVGNPDAAEGGALVALVGQVTVAVSGEAAAGDVLIASGAADGRARAVSPERYSPADGAVLGRVLTVEDGRVVALVGVDEAAALRDVVARQADRLDRQAAQIEALAERLARLEAHFAPAP